MKSLLQFWRVMANEMAIGCHASTNIEKDFSYLNARFEHEGLSFLTISLPTFAKDFERCLELGMVDPYIHFQGWKYCKGLPAFLGGFLDQVFDRVSGDLLDDPDPFSVRAVRQLTRVFGKIELDCPDFRVDQALDQFVKTDREVGIREDGYLNSALQAEFRQTALIIAGDIFAKLDEDVHYDRILPKHGPGSTAERITGNSKFYQLEWTERLETVFPYGEYCLPSWRYYNSLDDVHFRSPGEERPVRVVTVPKTQEAPRIIAIEPVGMQYCQQGLMERIVNWIETDHVLGTVVGFTDQSPNQQLAREGSQIGSLATLDLSEASDRVSYQHVMDLMHWFPFVREAVDVCRSTRASVPPHFYHGETVVELRKFASMGSALCFPMEALVFTTVIAMALFHDEQQRCGHTPPLKNRQSFQRLLQRVRVYGDDIIVPVDNVTTVMHYFDLFGFKVNVRKSFWKGKFRESCGKEYFSGHDVSVVKVRREFPSSRRDVRQIVSTVSLRNQLWSAGWLHTAEYLDREIIGKVLPHYPVVEEGSAVLGRLSHEDLTIDAHSDRLHSPLVKGYVVSYRPPVDPLDDFPALMKWFLKRSDKPFDDPNHLLRAGRPDAVYLKRRLCPVNGFRKSFVDKTLDHWNNSRWSINQD